MSLKAKVEAIIYATQEPVTLNELVVLLKDAVLADLASQPMPTEASEGVTSNDQPESENSFLLNAIAEEDAAAAVAGYPLDSSDDEAVPPVKREKPSDEKQQLKAVKERVSAEIDELIADYASSDRGMEIRQIAGGYRMATKPEHHDVVVSFAKSLKPPVRLSLQALETLSVIAYKQPVTVPEIAEIRGVDSSGVIATLLDRKLITTAGRKQVIGRPILYKTTKEFLLRFGLNNISELPSMEEFEKLGDPQVELFAASGSVEQPAPPAIEDEPVTEAVPDPAHHLAGDSAIPVDGSYATEAVPDEGQEDAKEKL
jgi:segregation and condensation protein B